MYRPAAATLGAAGLRLGEAYAEWQETLNKARGLLKAIEVTEQRAG